MSTECQHKEGSYAGLEKQALRGVYVDFMCMRCGHIYAAPRCRMATRAGVWCKAAARNLAKDRCKMHFQSKWVAHPDIHNAVTCG